MLYIIVILALFAVSLASHDSQCGWNSRAGASFDLKPLQRTDKSKSIYHIKDGDIECTPEVEPDFEYTFNFCGNVPEKFIPSSCKSLRKDGAVLQYIELSSKEFDCYSLGSFSTSSSSSYYTLFDSSDPSKGVSVHYTTGDKCTQNGVETQRRATIDVMCSNTEATVYKAYEPQQCSYIIQLKSFYGCPKECPVTSNGLCNSHGHCAYDKEKKRAGCYCDQGYGGEDCSTKIHSQQAGRERYDEGTGNSSSLQISFIVILIIIALGMTGFMIYLSMQVAQYRKQQVASFYSTLPGGENEIETVSFR